MAHVLAGCLLERFPGPRALARLGFFEYAPRPPLPTFATLARLRKQAVAWPQVALVAPRSCWSSARGAMRPGPELDTGLDWLTRVADILESFAIVLATGAELTTGERDRSLLASVVERLRATGRTLVIAPRGLWEPEHAQPFAAKIGAVYGFDPLEHEAPPGELVYARVRPMGARPRLTEGHLAQIAERVTRAAAVRGYVSIESEQCARDAARLGRQLAELDGEAEVSEHEVATEFDALDPDSNDPDLETDADLDDPDDDDDADEEQDADDVEAEGAQHEREPTDSDDAD